MFGVQHMSLLIERIIKHRSEVFEYFKSFQALVEWLFDHKILAV
jgi:hypothetical protein